MPAWEFLGEKDIGRLTAFLQAQGGLMADERMARQNKWKNEAIAAYGQGVDANIEWLHSWVPEGWQVLPNPYPASSESIERGRIIYEQFCINCHGPMGGGDGPAAQYLDPPPLNFTTLRRHLIKGKYIGGLLYYQIMNGVTGTAMMFFKQDLESEKIWDVSNYVGVYFIGYTDADIEPKGIDASYEPSWINPFEPPTLPTGGSQ